MSEPQQKPGKSRQDFATPHEFIVAVEARFGPLVADLAASAENAVCEAWIGEAENSLSVPWAMRFPGGNLWLNPPFGDIGQWAKKAALESTLRHGLILMLTPASIGTAWFAEHVNKNAMVLGLRPRLTFVGAPAPFPKDLALSVFGSGMHGFDCWRWK